MLLDSTFLVDLLRKKDPKVFQKAAELEQRFEFRTISSVSILELWRGALRSLDQEAEKQAVEALLQSLIIYYFDELTAKKAAEIEADLTKRGEMIDLEDIMIAATAIVHYEPLLTRNGRHFKRIKGLNVEEY